MIDILFGLVGAFCIAFGCLYFASIILNAREYTEEEKKNGFKSGFTFIGLGVLLFVLTKQAGSLPAKAGR